MSEDEIRRSQRSYRLESRLLVWVPLGLVLYVASIGPAAAIFGDSPGPVMDRVLRAFYAPVRFLGEYTPARKPLESWIEMWVKSRD